MVSALASSSVRLPRNVSVKVLVSDCDLLRRPQGKGQRSEVRGQRQGKEFLNGSEDLLQLR